MEVIEEYSVIADGFEVPVMIKKHHTTIKTYEIQFPEISRPTQALLDDIRHNLVVEVPVSSSEILDPEAILKIKEKFRQRAVEYVRKSLPTVNEKMLVFLVTSLLHDMVGFGRLEFLLGDPQLEEIIVLSALEQVRVYHKKYGWLITNISMPNEAQIQNYCNIIGRRVGRQISTLVPLLDAHLPTGDRANAVLFPISNKGHTITIRKFARDPWTVTDLINSKTSSLEIFSFIWLAMQYEMNILISGGTGSGKTSFLNVILPFIPPDQRILSIEDTRELQLPKYLYWCPLTTRQANSEGKGEVSMLDLSINALRMRPDRIILGEMRRKSEAEVLFEAMHTGHSVCATLHADTINETISRLINPPLSVPANLLGAVNLNIVMFRDRRRGIRRTYQIGEYVITDEGDRTIVNGNAIYRWKPGEDSFVLHSKSSRFFEDLSRRTGLSDREIDNDLKQKSSILTYLVKHNIRQIHDVGRILNEYYLNQENLLSVVEKNLDPGEIINAQEDKMS
jgi:archaeal flagellar protein FlaI